MSAEMLPYTKAIWTQVVKKISKAVGFGSAQTVGFQLLLDIAHNYIRELCIQLHNIAELQGRVHPALQDFLLVFKEMNIDLSDLEDYAHYISPIALNLRIPEYPVKRVNEYGLKFLKPGSQEVLTRPIHVHEHLPPMYPDPAEGKNTSIDTRCATGLPSLVARVDEKPTSSPFAPSTSVKLETADNNDSERPQVKVKLERGARVRELGSVLMTTSGFLSPAKEGKIPEARIPSALSSDSSQSSVPPVTSGAAKAVISTPPSVKGERDRVGKIPKSGGSHHRKHLSAEKKKPSQSVTGTLMSDAAEDTKEHSSSSDFQLKQLSIRLHDTYKSHLPVLEQDLTSAEVVKSEPSSSFMSKEKLEKAERNKYIGEDQSHYEKLRTEPDKWKQNIFKKIAKVKDVLKNANNDGVGDWIELNSNNKFVDNGYESVYSQWERTMAERQYGHSNDQTVSVSHTASPKKRQDNGKRKYRKKKNLMDSGAVKKHKIEEEPIAYSNTFPNYESRDDFPPPPRKKKKRKKNNELPENSVPLEITSQYEDSTMFLNEPHSYPTDSYFGYHDTDEPLLEQQVVQEEYNDGSIDSDYYHSHFATDDHCLLPPSLSNNPLIPRFPPFGYASYQPDAILPPLPPPEYVTSKLPSPVPEFVAPIEIETYKNKAPIEIETYKNRAPIEIQTYKDSASDDDKRKKETHGEKRHRKKEKKKKKKKEKLKHHRQLEELERAERERDEELKRIEKKRMKEKKKKDKHRSHDKIDTVPSREGSGSIPKLKLKLSSPSSPTISQPSPKIKIKPVIERSNASPERSLPFDKHASYSKREKKQKKQNKSTGEMNNVYASLPGSSRTVEPITINIQSVDKKKKEKNTKKVKEKRTVHKETDAPTLKKVERPAPYYFDELGNQIWICPGCRAQDDGSPMIGCDGCDAWYHWVCVGIHSAPECAKWFCPYCKVK